jgi:hypothetical protein
MIRKQWGEDGMYKSDHGDFVLYAEAQAEIDALKAELANEQVLSAGLGKMMQIHRDELDALKAAQIWQPIESAPTDGTDFLIDHEGVTIARWMPDGSQYPWIFLDLEDGKFVFNRLRESVVGLVWRPKPLRSEAIAPETAK